MLDTLSYSKVYKFFEIISQIPRGSGDEKRISDYLVSFAKERNLKFIQDKLLNVIIYKDGRGDIPLALQGHIDMVCEKNSDSLHDFLKDPIKLKIEDGFICAENTTLGADNGIACAMMLAILDSNVEHPPLEAIFTTNEETGMDGALALNGADIKAKRIINIDSEEDGVFLASCAGGMRVDITYPISFCELSSDYKRYNLRVFGLTGGHSGIEIDKGRANSNVIIARIIKLLSHDASIFIENINGGSKDNAIAREANAIFATDDENIIAKINVIKELFKKEVIVTDPNFEVICEITDSKAPVITQKQALNIIDALLLIPNGVQAMSYEIEDLVETSNNIGVVIQLEDKIIIRSALRSSVESKKKFLQTKMEIVANLTNGVINVSSEYPAWEYNRSSKLRDIFIDEYQKLVGHAPKIKAIHAGLECGVLSNLIPDVDIIAIGPEILGAHTPKERLNIASNDRVFNLLIQVLAKL